MRIVVLPILVFLPAMAACGAVATTSYIADHGTGPVRQCMMASGLFVAVARGSEQLADQARDQIAHWNAAAGRQLLLWAGTVNIDLDDYVPRNVILVGLRAGLADERAERSPAGRRSCGITGYSSTSIGCFLRTQIEIEPDCARRPDLLATILRHELGHALGLGHGDGGLMVRAYDSGTRHPVPVAPGEVRAVLDLYHFL